MNRRQLEELTRDELIARAERLGVPRPRVLTQAELVDEILGRTAKSADEKKKARGFFGRARDLLASVLELGLNLPEAAKVLRDRPAPRSWPAPPTPVPTVTLAEIYAAQGHLAKAIAVLEELLAGEPEHVEALALRARFARDLEANAATRGPSVAPPEPNEEAEEAALLAEEEEAPRAAQVARETPESAPSAVSARAEAELAPVVASAPPAVAATSERYDLDEVVAVAVDPSSLYVYWEIRPRSLAHARATSPEGKVVLRVITIAPSWDGPEVVTRDFVVDELHGERFVRDLPAGADARVSVGWQFAGGYDPFAVGMELTMPRGEPSKQLAQTTGRFGPEPSPTLLATVRMELFQGPVGSDRRDGPERALSLSWTGAALGASPAFAAPRGAFPAAVGSSPIGTFAEADVPAIDASFVPVRRVIRAGGSSGFGGASGWPSSS
jgi:hypothetical protein